MIVHSDRIMPSTSRSHFSRSMILAAFAVLGCWPWTVTSGRVAIVLGVTIGGALAVSPRARRLRAAIVPGIAISAMALGWYLSRLVVDSQSIGQLLGPMATLQVADLVLGGLVGFGASFLVRWLASQTRWGVIGEVLWTGGALVSVFAAHRDGMIHRPYALGDWSVTRGLDPAMAFFSLGGFAILVAAVFLFRGRERRAFHFSWLLLLVILTTLAVRWMKPPAPGASADLGLSGQEQESEQTSDDELDFRDEYSPDRNNSPVAVVLLHDEYSPTTGVYYFRQNAFSRYNGRRLVRALAEDADTDLLDHFPSSSTELDELPPQPELRTSVSTTIGLIVEHTQPFTLDTPIQVRNTKNPNPFRFQRAYSAVSLAQTVPYPELIGQLSGNPSWTEELWELYTDLPDEPRYRELAQLLTANLRPELSDDPLAKAFSIKNYLDSEGIYSLRSQHQDADDPAASFLFGDLTGYCVHFAHAATYLFRSLGIPARVASGYAIPESSRAGGSAILIQGANAHAWPEIYLRDIGWVVVDPAPRTTLDQPLTAADPNLQRLLGEMLRESTREQPLPSAARPWPSLAEIASWFGWLAITLLAIAYSIKAYRLLTPRWPWHDRTRRRLAFRAILDRCAELGLKRDYGEPREHFARRIQPSAPSFSDLTDQHLATSLGPSKTHLDPSWSELISEVRAELTETYPWWRRLLGRLNPISWTAVH